MIPSVKSESGEKNFSILPKNNTIWPICTVGTKLVGKLCNVGKQQFVPFLKKIDFCSVQVVIRFCALLSFHPIFRVFSILQK